MSEQKKVFEIPYEYALQFPIKVTEERNEETIVFARRLNAGDMANIVGDENGQMPPGKLYPIIAGMTGLSPALLQKMDWKDMEHCLEVVNSFL